MANDLASTRLHLSELAIATIWVEAEGDVGNPGRREVSMLAVDANRNFGTNGVRGGNGCWIDEETPTGDG